MYQPGRSEAQWQMTPEFDVLSSFFTAQAQHRLFTPHCPWHAPHLLGVSSHKANFVLVYEKRPACHSVFIKNLCENARCPFLDY